MQRKMIFMLAVIALISMPICDGRAAIKIYCPSAILPEFKALTGIEPWQLDEFSTQEGLFGFRVSFEDSGVIRAIALCFAAIHQRPIFELYDVIQERDADDLQRLLDARKNLDENQKTILTLSSPGGDLQAALRIARLLQDRLSIALVSTDQPCLSACFFVLVGATVRLAGPDSIGIHSPYYQSETFSGLSPDDARTAYVKLSGDLRRFLVERGLSPELVERMLRIPSTQIHVMTESELRAIGFSILEPIFREHTLARIRNNCTPISEEAYVEFLNDVDVCTSGRVLVDGISASCVGDVLSRLETRLQQQNCAALAQ